MQPNYEVSGGAQPHQQKIYLSNIEYAILNKHIEYSDQHLGAVHSLLFNKDVKCIKVVMIILINDEWSLSIKQAKPFNA